MKAIQKLAYYFLVVMIPAIVTAGCVPVPAVEQSRDVLWSQYGNQPVDGLLLAWGTPVAETHLTNSGRMLSYEYNVVYDAQSTYEHTLGCKVTFLATPPKFLITNIAMEGSASECQQMAAGRRGTYRIPAAPAASAPAYMYPYHRYPY